MSVIIESLSREDSITVWWQIFTQKELVATIDEAHSSKLVSESVSQSASHSSSSIASSVDNSFNT